MPNGFGTSSGSFKLCSWTISIALARGLEGSRRHLNRAPARPVNGAPLLQSPRMAKVVHASEFFVVGGPVQPDRLGYVERAPERAFEAALRAGSLVYVLSAPGT